MLLLPPPPLSATDTRHPTVVNMNIADAYLNSYLVRHLQPLTEADPNILAKYVAALLKNNKPKEELHALCVEKLWDFLGEDSTPFIDNLFHDLYNGNISVIHNEPYPKKANYATISTSTRPTSTVSSVITTSENVGKQMVSQSKRNRNANKAFFSDHEDDATDDENDGMNQKHKGHVNISRFPEKYCVKKRPRLTVTDNNRSSHICSEKNAMYRQPPAQDHVYGILSRDVTATVKKTGPWSPCDQKNSCFAESDFNTTMSLPAVCRPSYVHGNSAQSFGPGYDIYPGLRDQSTLQNAGPQGSRGASISGATKVGLNFGIGLNIGPPKCPDYEELGYCLRGDLCLMNHGANRIVVEDVQSLSKFNLPVAIIGNHGMGLPATNSSSVGFSTMHVLGTSISHLNEPDVYDPDETLGCKKKSTSVVDGLKKFPSSRNGMSSTGSNFMMKGQCVWNGIGGINDVHYPSVLVECPRDAESNLVDLDRVIHEERKMQRNSRQKCNVKNISEHAIEVGNHANETNNQANIKNKAQSTLYVGCIPHDKKNKKTLMTHFQRFGEVVDIKIPCQGDSAFVQFSQQEEAKAALASPDAVMGNRFIRLSWARRDSIQTIHFESNIPSQINGSKPMSSVSCSIKPIDLNALPMTPDVAQGREEEIKRMKEEISKKYEDLAKKREQFRHRLLNLSKQTRLKSCENANLLKIQLKGIQERLNESEKKLFHESNGSPARVSHGTTKSGASVFPFAQKRGSISFKIDNRTAIFRIIPPFPDSLLNISALKKHFSVFGELLSVEIENIDLNSDITSLGKDGIRVSFATRSAAERAFLWGRCYKGINLQFAWYPSPKIAPSDGNLTSGNQDGQVSYTSESGKRLEIQSVGLDEARKPTGNNDSDVKPAPNIIETVQPHFTHLQGDGHRQIQSDHSPDALDVQHGPDASKVTAN